jgi:hypothetical protein
MNFKGSVAKNILATFFSSYELFVVTTSRMVSEFLQQNQTYSNCIPYNEREEMAEDLNTVETRYVWRERQISPCGSDRSGVCTC